MHQCGGPWTAGRHNRQSEPRNPAKGSPKDALRSTKPEEASGKAKKIVAGKWLWNAN